MSAEEDMGWATVLAFDPGGTTGWCVMCANPSDLVGEKPFSHKLFQHVASGQIIGSEFAQVDQVVELVDIWPDAAVVAESFQQRIRNTGLETDPAYSPVRSMRSCDGGWQPRSVCSGSSLPRRPRAGGQTTGSKQ